MSMVDQLVYHPLFSNLFLTIFYETFFFILLRKGLYEYALSNVCVCVSHMQWVIQIVRDQLVQNFSNLTK